MEEVHSLFILYICSFPNSNEFLFLFALKHLVIQCRTKPTKLGWQVQVAHCCMYLNYRKLTRDRIQ